MVAGLIVLGILLLYLNTHDLDRFDCFRWKLRNLFQYALANFSQQRVLIGFGELRAGTKGAIKHTGRYSIG